MFLLSLGAARVLTGGGRAASRLADVDPQVVQKLHSQLVSIANSDLFKGRMLRAGLDPEAIPRLVDRLGETFKRGDIGFSQAWFGGWFDETQFLVGRFAGHRTLMHELTHLLDDVLNPGLLRSLDDLSVTKTFARRADIIAAEYKAFMGQYGIRPWAGLLARGTVFFNIVGAEPAFYIGRQLFEQLEEATSGNDDPWR